MSKKVSTFFFYIEKNDFEHICWVSMGFPCNPQGDSLMTPWVIRESLMIYKEIPFKFKKIFQNRFSQWKTKVAIFFYIYTSVEIHALSIYNIFRTFWALLPWLIPRCLTLRLFPPEISQKHTEILLT